jgi:tRNA A37 threonylcarbamoyladenosine biosynthesis protein TsaE
MRFVLALLATVGVLCLAYLAATAYLGYRVGAAIHQAEQRVIVREGAHVVGRAAFERFAIKRSGIPAVLVESPTFWLALHRTE